MYRKLLSAILLATASPAAFAQATLTPYNYNPYLGDQYIVKICDTTGIVPGAGGAGKTWNFSSLIATHTDTGTAVSCAATPSCPLFSASTSAIVNPGGTMTTYLITDVSRYSQNGYYGSATQNTIYSDPVDQLRYPFTFGSSFTDTYAGLVTYTPSGFPTIYATETGSVTTTCDAWGTLTIPGNAGPVTHSNVLRAHSIQTFRDSANLFGTPTVGTYTLESYTWYTPGYHAALLTISTAVGPGVNTKIVSHAYQKLRTAIPETDDIESSMALFPNPATSELNIRFNAGTNDHYRISLTDILGREVTVIADKDMQGTQSINTNVSSYPKGLYIVRLQSATGTVSRKISIQ